MEITRPVGLGSSSDTRGVLSESQSHCGRGLAASWGPLGPGGVRQRGLPS